MSDKIFPKKLEQVKRDILKITWNDESATQLKVRAIRLACKCASCIDEWTRERLIQDKDIPMDILPVRIESVGRYALSFSWTDGHNTGIYTFDHLRSLEE